MRLAILGNFVDSINKRAESREPSCVRGEARGLELLRPHGRPSSAATPTLSAAGGTRRLRRPGLPMRRLADADRRGDRVAGVAARCGFVRPGRSGMRRIRGTDSWRALPDPGPGGTTAGSFPRPVVTAD